MKNTFKNEIVAVDKIVADDNFATYGVDSKSMAELPTPWGGTISRASSSKLADGAAACVLMNEAGLKK